MEPYGERLRRVVAATGPLCAGIDPHPGVLRAWGLPVDVTGLERCARTVVAALAGTVGVFKPQSAFFEAYGSAGIAVLERTLTDIRATGGIALLDVKRGDIGSTMDAYGAAYLTDGSPLAADAITVSPYLGFGALSGVVELAGRTGRGLYVLAVTSNPEGRVVQRAREEGSGQTVAQTIVDGAAAANAGAGFGHVGLVVGLTAGPLPIDLSRLNGSILAPGLGAQGGTAEDLPQVFGATVGDVLPAASRELLSAGPDVAALRERAERIRGQIQQATSVE